MLLNYFITIEPVINAILAVSIVFAVVYNDMSYRLSGCQCYSRVLDHRFSIRVMFYHCVLVDIIKIVINYFSSFITVMSFTIINYKVWPIYEIIFSSTMSDESSTTCFFHDHSHSIILLCFLYPPRSYQHITYLRSCHSFSLR